MDTKFTVVAHNGNFHADDIFAVATLLLVLGEENVSVVRTRDFGIIEKADYVVDVGGIYDEARNRFDHHQTGGAGERQNTVPYASFGLVWKKYGEQLCGDPEVAQKIDQILVQWIDAMDNGIEITETKVPGVYPYDIGLFFNSFIPSWREGDHNIDKIFMDMVSIAKTVLTREISKRKDLLETGFLVEKIYKESENKKLIIFDKYYPARELLSKFPEPLFTVFPRDDGDWAMKTIQNDSHSFSNRKDLPQSWAGKSGEELEKITGVPGSVFCHRNRFLVVAKTKEGILKLAEIALNQ